ncbi:Retrovirus-related Pol polyprotein from transposon TNT 1-94 [Gossypium australe]|uniref:Retrovirus-related Pol polyprotein from transposon TNT 1-94 n=1 Tax=Gossypium australe TaxID=47621 RepID=A0A5B6UEN5_9ROSI|nr:Retrovirus-related Pol polyprotein from transposon TNT 1-94 [Gossypium australe]
MFLGYSPSHKGYHCQDANGKIYISGHVTFHELSFPFKTINPNSHPTTTSSQSSSKLLVMNPTRLPTTTTVHNVLPRPTTTSNRSTPLVHSSSTATPLFNPTSSQLSSPTSTTPSHSPIASQPTTHQPPAPPTTTQPNSHAMITRNKAGIFKPKAYLTKADCSPSDTPVNIHEAMQSEYWQTAVHSELQALLKNNTWSLCLLLGNRRAVGCKWLFKVKKKANGTVDRYKARLVAKGFSQHAGLDFRDMFSPVIDVNNAFLNGDLTEDIYMEQPPGFEVLGANGQQLVCKLNKTLYGLHQAPRAWFHTLKQYLVTRLNFNASKADPSLFIRTSSENVVLLMVYVDDIVITAATTLTPMVNTPKLTASDGSPPFTDVHLYRSTMRMLQYLCITRLRLSFCVNKLSRYMNLQSEMHLRAVKRVLRYLVGTVDHGLYFSKGRAELVCYSDAYWASSIEDRRSTTGYVVYLGPNPVAWCSKKQSVVSRSSSEAEYRSLANCVSELLRVKQLIGEIGVSSCPTPVIWCDNTSTVPVAANPTHHA